MGSVVNFDTSEYVYIFSHFWNRPVKPVVAIMLAFYIKFFRHLSILFNIFNDILALDFFL